jgi:hypothetical protein
VTAGLPPECDGRERSRRGSVSVVIPAYTATATLAEQLEAPPRIRSAAARAQHEVAGVVRTDAEIRGDGRCVFSCTAGGIGRCG